MSKKVSTRANFLKVSFYISPGPGGMGVAASWGGAAVGPVGSGRPDRSGRVVWPGA